MSMSHAWEDLVLESIHLEVVKNKGIKNHSLYFAYVLNDFFFLSSYSLVQ